MMRKRYNDDYDSDDDIYRDDDDDLDEVDDVVDEDELDYTYDDEDADDEAAEDGVNTRNQLEEQSISKSFNPADYDFDQILADYHSGDDKKRAHAIEQAVRSMEGLVKHIIKRHYPTYLEKHYEDMLQTGLMAVVQTLGKYDGKSCAPSSFFYTNIKHEIQVFIAENVHRITRHYAAMANQIRKAELALAQIDGKEYHDDLTISVYTGISLTTVSETRRQISAADFAELNPNLDTDAAVRDDYGNPAETYWKSEQSAAIQKALDRLYPTEAKILRMTYGLDGEPCNPPEIARRLGLKTDQVRKIAQEACRKLSHDKRLKRDLGMNDRLSAEKDRVVTAMPFVPVQFGEGKNFFEEFGEECGAEANNECTSFEEMLKPMSFTDDTDTST